MAGVVFNAQRTQMHNSRLGTIIIDCQTEILDAGAQVKAWWVPEAPTGQRFCVVRPQWPDFAEQANPRPGA
jgi:hypothetical protein